MISNSRSTIALLLSVCLVGSVFFLRSPRRAEVDVVQQELKVDGTTRSFRVVVPATLAEPKALVVAFHGIGDTADSMASYSKLDQLAADKGFVLVYPESQGAMWMTELALDAQSNNPDLIFFDRLLESVLERYLIAPERVYVVGMSNGARFVHQLIAMRSEDVTAALVHSGIKPKQIPAPSRQVPVMLVSGEEDIQLQGVLDDAQSYRAAGHVVEVLTVEGLGHEWSSTHNDSYWKFLAAFQLGGEG